MWKKFWPKTTGLESWLGGGSIGHRTTTCCMACNPIEFSNGGQKGRKEEIPSYAKTGWAEMGRLSSNTTSQKNTEKAQNHTQ